MCISFVPALNQWGVLRVRPLIRVASRQICRVVRADRIFTTTTATRVLLQKFFATAFLLQKNFATEILLQFFFFFATEVLSENFRNRVFVAKYRPVVNHCNTIYADPHLDACHAGEVADAATAIHRVMVSFSLNQ